jgi:hypothetical protein
MVLSANIRANDVIYLSVFNHPLQPDERGFSDQALRCTPLSGLFISASRSVLAFFPYKQLFFYLSHHTSFELETLHFVEIEYVKKIRNFMILICIYINDFA